MTRPLSNHLRLLDDALTILDAGELLAEDEKPLAVHAGSKLDEFLHAMQSHDRSVYPPGFLDRITRIRVQLANDPREAKRQLRQACLELVEELRAHESEGRWQA